MRSYQKRRLVGVLIASIKVFVVLSAIIFFANMLKVERVVPPNLAGATSIFAGQPKRALPVIDTKAKPSAKMVNCPPPLDVVAPTMQDSPRDSVPEAECDWYYKTFDTRAPKKK